MEKMDNNELISALTDGQLRGDELDRAVALAAGDAVGRSTWQAYQTVGEVLRSGQAVRGGMDSEAFLARLQVRLQAETMPASRAAPRLVETATAVVARPQAPANDWRWKLVAGVASVAAVAAVGWNLAGPVLAPPVQPQLAAAPAAPAAVASEAVVQQAAMIRDPRLDQLLAAHRQLGGATALQSTSGFLRNATFEGPAR